MTIVDSFQEKRRLKNGTNENFCALKMSIICQQTFQNNFER